MTSNSKLREIETNCSSVAGKIIYGRSTAESAQNDWKNFLFLIDSELDEKFSRLHSIHMTMNKSTAWQALERIPSSSHSHWRRLLERKPWRTLNDVDGTIDSLERSRHALTASNNDHNSPDVLLFINTFVKHLFQTSSLLEKTSQTKFRKL